VGTVPKEGELVRELSLGGVFTSDDLSTSWNGGRAAINQTTIRATVFNHLFIPNVSNSEKLRDLPHAVATRARTMRVFMMMNLIVRQ